MTRVLRAALRARGYQVASAGDRRGGARRRRRRSQPVGDPARPRPARPRRDRGVPPAAGLVRRPDHRGHRRRRRRTQGPRPRRGRRRLRDQAVLHARAPGPAPRRAAPPPSAPAWSTGPCSRSATCASTSASHRCGHRRAGDRPVARRSSPSSPCWPATPAASSPTGPSSKRCGGPRRCARPSTCGCTPACSARSWRDDPVRPRLVTEPGVGYRLVDPDDAG